jgi:serine/threonine protein kinase
VYDDAGSKDSSQSGTDDTINQIETKPNPLTGRIMYIQMELCRMSLKDVIIKINHELNHNINEPMTIIGAFIASQLIYEIVKGIDYLHSSSPPIIHRDLKPQNIYLTDGRGGNFIKIGDFGSATFHVKNDETLKCHNIKTQVLHTQESGTFQYMAPEVKESKIYDKTCDIYSLGCIGMDFFAIDKEKFSAINDDM